MPAAMYSSCESPKTAAPSGSPPTSATECPVPVKKIGIYDVFGHSGPAKDLLKEFGLSWEHIVEVAKDFCRKA